MKQKNPHAVALGQLGGEKGGKARAESLTARERRAIARQGGLARHKTLQSLAKEFADRLAKPSDR